MTPILETDKQQFLASWIDGGFSRVRRELENLILPAVQLCDTRCEDETIGIGKSKLGGRPDLRDAANWPATREGRPLAFIAQISLRDVAELDWVRPDLPEDGILSFFTTLKRSRGDVG